MKRIIGGVAIAALLSAGAQTALAASAAPRPTHLHGGQHSCSYTRTEYLLTDENMAVTAQPGSTWFTARHVPGVHAWEDAYWVTGFHDEAASICDSRYVPGGGRAIPMPVAFTPYLRIAARLHAHGQGRLGFDIWLTADPRETTAAAMQGDPRTYEVLVSPGTPPTVREQHPGWHRIFIGAIPQQAYDFNLNIDVAALLRNLGIPHRMWLMAVDAGGEATAGSFTVDSYGLAIWRAHRPVFWITKHRSMFWIMQHRK